MAEAVAAVVSLGKLAAGHGRHSQETLSREAPEDEWARQEQQQSEEEAFWCVYLGNYSSLTTVSDLQEKQNNQSSIMSSPYESSVENTANKGNQSE